LISLQIKPLHRLMWVLTKPLAELIGRGNRAEYRRRCEL